MLRCTLVGIGTERHFAAAQQTVAFGPKADIDKDGWKLTQGWPLEAAAAAHRTFDLRAGRFEPFNHFARWEAMLGLRGAPRPGPSHSC